MRDKPRLVGQLASVYADLITFLPFKSTYARADIQMFNCGIFKNIYIHPSLIVFWPHDIIYTSDFIIGTAL